jgi:hypothetical protein
VLAGDAPAGAGLGADDLAVELGEADGQRGRQERRGGGLGRRRVELEREDERQADDRAVDDARDLARPEVG